MIEKAQREASWPDEGPVRDVAQVFEAALTHPRTGESLLVGRFLHRNFFTVETDQEGLYLVFVSSYPPESQPLRGGFEEVYRWDENFKFLDSRGLKRYANGDRSQYSPKMEAEEVLEKLVEKNRIAPTRYDLSKELSTDESCDFPRMINLASHDFPQKDSPYQSEEPHQS